MSPVLFTFSYQGNISYIHSHSVNLFSVVPTDLTGPGGRETGEHIGREEEKDG